MDNWIHYCYKCDDKTEHLSKGYRGEDEMEEFECLICGSTLLFH